MKRIALEPECLQLYLSGCTLEQIREITGLAMSTLSAWKQAGDWTGKRRALASHPDAIGEACNRLVTSKLMKIEEAVAAGGDVDGAAFDGLSKIAAVAAKYRRQVDTPREALNVVRQQIEWAKAHIEEADKFGDFVGHLQNYLKEVQEKHYGKRNG